MATREQKRMYRQQDSKQLRGNWLCPIAANESRLLPTGRKMALGLRSQLFFRLEPCGKCGSHTQRTLKGGCHDCFKKNIAARARVRRKTQPRIRISYRKALFDLLCKIQKDHCYWCNKLMGGIGHIDHIHAMSRGGQHSADNMCAAHAFCNIQKNAKSPMEFAGMEV